MKLTLLSFPHKKIRSQVIKEYIKKDYKQVVCFSCGNAARALEEEGLNVIHIGTQGELTPNKWYTMQEIHNRFPTAFDATSGHLNMELMKKIGQKYKEYLGELDETMYIPTGSGETLVCLKLAYPEQNFIAVYNLGVETEFNTHAPLNKLVEWCSDKIIYNPIDYMIQYNKR